MRRWRVAGAAVAGRRHRRVGEPSDDVVVWKRQRGVIALALADGAGSARFGRLGAETVAASTVRMLVSQFVELFEASEEESSARVNDRLERALSGAAIGARCSVRDLASTLLFVAARGERFVAGQVGDGILAQSRGDVFLPLFEPVQGEHLNETVFVGSTAGRDTFQFSRGEIGPGLSGFVSMSDGSAESLFLRKEARVAPAAGTMSGWLADHAERNVCRGLSGVLERRVVPRTFDDCSIGLLNLVESSSEELMGTERPFLREFVGSRNIVGASNRLKILGALERGVPTEGRELAEATGISARTAEKHLQELTAISTEEWGALGGMLRASDGQTAPVRLAIASPS